MKKVGERIKRKRELLHISLNELATKVGISSSALSQIENAKSFPSIFTLKSIAENLNTSVGNLIGENEFINQNPVISKNDFQLITKNSSGTALYQLSQPEIHKQMDTYLLCFSANSNIDDLIIKSNGQVFGYVLSGELQILLNNKSYKLNKGDSCYFEYPANINIINKSEVDSELVWVSTNY